MFAQEIGERLMQEVFDGAVGIRREVFDAAVFLGLDNKRQAPLSGPASGKVRFRGWRGLFGKRHLGFRERLRALGKTWSFLMLLRHIASKASCCQRAQLLASSGKQSVCFLTRLRFTMAQAT